MEPCSLRFEISPAGCWLWTGALNKQGYGQVKHCRKVWLAHRLSYTVFVGAIGIDLEIDHLCKIRNCINPKHLEEVTHGDNMKRVRYATGWRPRKRKQPRIKKVPKPAPVINESALRDNIIEMYAQLAIIEECLAK